jgi:hypothetical protein
MDLSESYKERLKYLSGLIGESKKNSDYEYQIRDIGGDVFYKRKKGSKEWCFIDKIEFYKNSNKKNIVIWEVSKENKSKNQNFKNNIKPSKENLKTYKSYYENLSPSSFDVEIKGDSIIIKIK